MKINWGILKIVVISGLIVFLFSFSKQRNELRKITKIEVEFIDENELFITQNSVNKLLIQKKDSTTSIDKETLVLNKMENVLLKNQMIKNAEIFVTIDGVLGVKVEQRKPIARVSGSPDFYIDEEGKKMPLSTEYSARVPIVTGATKDMFFELRQFLFKINEDDFMKESIIGIHIESDKNIILRMRKNNFNVLFGKVTEVEKKIQNFKAFYNKTKQDSLLTSYSLVNLKFNNQVVATKR
jgi:cell division protein FtsQ